MSQRYMARALGVSQAEVWKLERVKVGDVGIVRLAEMASVLGFELSVTLHPMGDAIRDKGQQAVIKRLRALLPAGCPIGAEVPFPNPGDPRHWDLLLRLGDQRVGVEAETRIRDVQELVRRMRGRERDGGADVVLLLLSESAHNRRLVAELRQALGPGFRTSPRTALAALRAGRPLAGCAVVLL